MICTYPVSASTVRNISGTPQLGCCCSALVEAAITSSKVSNRSSFKSLFIRGNKKKVSGGLVRWVGGIGHKCHALRGQKLTNSQRRVCGSVVMMNEPFATIRPCPLHPLPQSFQNPQVKLVDSLTPGNEFPVHNSLNVEETDQHCFDIWSHLSDFFWARVNEESSTGLMPACFRGHIHNTDFRHPLWPWTRSLGHFQAPFSSPRTQRVGISVGPLWADGDEFCCNTSHA